VIIHSWLTCKIFQSLNYYRIEAFQDKTHLYLSFEYVQGGEIFRLLRKERYFPNDVALFYTTEIILSLEYMHNKQIAYRDLKPENLLIAADGHLKITDFGFAKRIQDKTYTLCGTPEYLAPEIILSTGHNRGVDWWALGILLFEMLAGYPPFYDENPIDIYRKITTGYYEFPSNISTNARDIISKLLESDVSRRLGSLSVIIF
jgi:serine/threonine protein kinase